MIINNVVGEGNYVVNNDGVAYRKTSRRAAEAFARYISKEMHSEVNVYQEGHPGYPQVVYWATDGRGRKVNW